MADDAVVIEEDAEEDKIEKFVSHFVSLVVVQITTSTTLILCFNRGSRR